MPLLNGSTRAVIGSSTIAVTRPPSFGNSRVMKTCRKPNRASAQSETTGPSGECRVCVLPPLASLETTQQSSRALARLASGRVLAAGVPMHGTRVDL